MLIKIMGGLNSNPSFFEKISFRMLNLIPPQLWLRTLEYKNASAATSEVLFKLLFRHIDARGRNIGEHERTYLLAVLFFLNFKFQLMISDLNSVTQFCCGTMQRWGRNTKRIKIKQK